MFLEFLPVPCPFFLSTPSPFIATAPAPNPVSDLAWASTPALVSTPALAAVAGPHSLLLRVDAMREGKASEAGQATGAREEEVEGEGGRERHEGRRVSIASKGSPRLYL